MNVKHRKLVHDQCFHEMYEDNVTYCSVLFFLKELGVSGSYILSPNLTCLI